MADFLPISEPAKYILPLISADRTLAEGAHEIPIPPVDPESIFLLHHAGVRQAVYRGTLILDRLCDMPLSQVETLPPAMLFRHLLDLGDSIGTLLRFGSASNGAILLRSLFESLIGLEFMLKDSTLQLERARCYWVSLRIKKYEAYVKYDPSTEPGKAFHHLLDSDQSLKTARFPREDRSKERKSLEQYFSDPRYKPIWDRYQNAKKGKKPREWYSLCSKAGCLRELAREIGREVEYALMYQQLSEFVHGTDVVTETLRHEPEEGTSIHQIRGPVTKINMVVMYALTCLLRSHNLILRAFFAKDAAFIKSYVDWYVTYQSYYRWSCGADLQPME